MAENEGFVTLNLTFDERRTSSELRQSIRTTCKEEEERTANGHSQGGSRAHVK